MNTESQHYMPDRISSVISQFSDIITRVRGTEDTVDELMVWLQLAIEELPKQKQLSILAKMQTRETDYYTI